MIQAKKHQYLHLIQPSHILATLYTELRLINAYSWANLHYSMSRSCYWTGLRSNISKLCE